MEVDVEVGVGETDPERAGSRTTLSHEPEARNNQPGKQERTASAYSTQLDPTKTPRTHE